MDNSLKVKVEFEIDQINKLMIDAKPLLLLCSQKEPDFIEKSAAALLIHSYYNGFESILLLISKAFDKEAFDTSKWHRNLFESAFEVTPNRGQVLDSNLKDDLGKYMQFRHFIRHSYSFQIVWDKMKPLIDDIEYSWKAVKENIIQFLKNN